MKNLEMTWIFWSMPMTCTALDDTIAFLKGVEGIPIYWVEEPFVENLEGGRKLKDWMVSNGRPNTYYADGERQPNHEVCRQLAGEQKLDVYLPDVVSLGFTPWRTLLPELIESQTLASPHAWGSSMKTYYTSHLAAGLGNICTIEGVTCFSEEIDFGDYQIVGWKTASIRSARVWYETVDMSQIIRQPCHVDQSRISLLLPYQNPNNLAGLHPG